MNMQKQRMWFVCWSRLSVWTGLYPLHRKDHETCCICSYYSLVAENKFHRCSHQLWCIRNLYLALLYKVLWKIFKHGVPVAVVYSASWRFLRNGLLCIIIAGSSSHNIWLRSCETASVMASYDCYLMPYNSDIWACCIHISCWPSAETLGCLWSAFFLWKTL